MLVEEGEERSSGRARGRGSNRTLLYVVGGVVAVGVLALIVWLAVSRTGGGASGGGSGGSGSNDTLVVGAGVGGLVTSLHLSPVLGSKLTVVDNRNHIGGKVLSRYLDGQSTEERPALTPTHAEQTRGYDVIMRCIGQFFNAVWYKRIGPGSYFDVRVRGKNASGYLCYGHDAPTDSASCDWGLPYEMVAPNGPDADPVWASLPDPCEGAAWTECSYEAAYWEIVLDSTNAATATAHESFYDYICRIFSNCLVGDYLKEVGIVGYLFDDDHSADGVIDYLNYDFAYPYGTISMPHGAPQLSILSKIGNYVEEHGSNITLELAVTAINYGPVIQGKKSFAVTFANGVTQNYHRVVAAMPLPQLALVQGEVVDKLRATKFMQFAGTTRACTMNLAFDHRWWQPRTSQCQLGHCALSQNFTLTDAGREYVTFSSWNNDETDPNAITFVQYVPSPERQQGNLLRTFYEEHQCAELKGFGTALEIKDEVMRRLRATYTTDGTIPEPTDYFWSDEPYAYAYLRRGALYGPEELRAWAAEPLPGELFSIVGENTEILDSGWMEGAARSAYHALRGPVFAGAITEEALAQFERCPAGETEDFLDVADPDGANGLCIGMKNEYNGRDLAGIPTCGTPDTYDYPTRTELIEGTYETDHSLWFGVASVPEESDAHEATLIRGRKNIVA